MPKYMVWVRWILVIPAAVAGMIFLPMVWDFFWSWCRMSEFYAHAIGVYCLPFLPLVWAGTAMAPSQKGVVGLVLLAAAAVLGVSESYQTVDAVLHQGYTWSQHDILAHIPLWSGVCLTAVGIAFAAWYALAVFRPARFMPSSAVSSLGFQVCIALAVVFVLMDGILSNVSSIGPNRVRVDGLGNALYPSPWWSHFLGAMGDWNGPRLFLVERVDFFGTIAILSAWSSAQQNKENPVRP